MRLAPLYLCSLILIGIAGCDTTPLEDDVVVTVSDGALVHVDCADECEQDGRVSIQLEYLDRYRTSDERLELHQYRVDYRLPALDEALPYFAAEARMTLSPGQVDTLTVRVAGAEQRAIVREASELELVAGTAALTLAGYGPDGEQVFLELELPIIFRSASSASDGGDDASE